MAYPNSIDTFSEKLNKKQDGSVYVIEEELPGNYDGPLAHDNINDDTVQVYSGSRLTGEKVENFILSIPSETPWNRLIKIFSDYEKVYVIYETIGDQVEAEDINRLQDSMTATQTEVNRYKSSNDLKVSDLQTNVRTLENKKSDKTYVDTELNKKANKVDVYTKSETDDRIQAVVGAAPEALDTLQEIGEALGNDPDFAGTMTNELSKKVDKVSGKQLSTEDYTAADKNKLSGIETGANKYVHPSTHPAAMITESASKRFVSDVEKAKWDGKLDKTGGTLTGPLTIQDTELSVESIKFDGATSAGFKVENPNGYVSIAPLNSGWAHIYSNRDKFIFNKPVYSTANTFSSYDNDFIFNRIGITKLRLALDQAIFADEIKAPNFVKNDGSTLETTTGAQNKVNAHANDETKHITSSERSAWNAKSNLALGETSSTAYRGDRGKIAYDHSQSAHAPSNAQKNSDITKAEIEAKLTGNITTHSHSQYVTQDQLGDAGFGDMTKAVYDTNNSGAADRADSVPWTGVTGKPGVFPPSSHTHDYFVGDDTRDVNSPPSDYLLGGIRYKAKSSLQVEFKRVAVAGLVGILKGSYCFIETYTPWSDTSGGYPIQIAYGDGGMCFRIGVSLTSWSEWAELLTTKKKVTWNDLKGV